MGHASTAWSERFIKRKKLQKEFLLILTVDIEVDGLINITEYLGASIEFATVLLWTSDWSFIINSSICEM